MLIFWHRADLAGTTWHATERAALEAFITLRDDQLNRARYVRAGSHYPDARPRPTWPGRNPHGHPIAAATTPATAELTKIPAESPALGWTFRHHRGPRQDRRRRGRTLGGAA